MRGELLEGLRYILRDPRWRALSAYVAASNFFFNVSYAVFLVYAARRLDLSPLQIGVTLSLGSLGWLGGALVANRISRRLGPGPTAILAAMASGPPLFLIPLAPQSYPIPFFVLSEVISGLAIVLFNINAISLMQALTPQRLLGRMNASRRFLVWGTIPLGALAGGVLGTEIGLRPTLIVGAVGASFCFIPLLFSPLRSIRELGVPLGPQVADA
jgi:MFS family permease